MPDTTAPHTPASAKKTARGRAAAKSASRSPAAPARKTAPSTRERVLETCRRLFNEGGPAAVTTAELAAEAGINEGNLYYYFKTKEQMLLALFERYEQALTVLHERAAQRSASGDAASYEASLEAFFNLVWNWRFLYRDGMAIIALAPGLQQRISTHARSTLLALQGEVRDMNSRGMLAVPEAQIEALARNAWIVCAYWFQYLQSGLGVKRLTRAHIMQGCDQVRALYLPYAVRSHQA